ncbi:MAG: LLM class flavin-dependent oxidoreductase [Nakamurella sp.]
MTTSPALSILDLVPVRTGQTSTEAVHSSLDLVRCADRLGLRRYWFAEHHNMPAVASTTPPVLAAAAAAQTERIRVGSGGMMLPNHSPLVVAEQFAALEALAPGRIDLGIGRAPGSDPVITQLLRMSGPTSDVERFPEYVENIRALVDASGAALQLANGGSYTVRATPMATSSPEVWLLGSSDYSARLAAELGLPYVFASHFGGKGLKVALDLYRSQFRPSEHCLEPRTFLTANAVAAPTVEEAEERAVPQLRMMARLRTGQPLIPLETVEQALAGTTDFDVAGQEIMRATRDTWFVGTGTDVADRLRDFAAQWEVDEIMLSPIAGSYDAEPMDTAPGRIQTLELVAAALGE